MNTLALSLHGKYRSGMLWAAALAAALVLSACGSSAEAPLVPQEPPASSQVVKDPLVEEMRVALAEGQFELHYQPQVEKGRIVSAEGLLRWRDPVKGLVPPVRFIPVAEESGFIVPLGQWVLQAAGEQLARWARQPETAHLVLSVNVSARQFQEADFVEQVLGAIARSGAPASKLKLEITESLLLADVESAIAKMNQLKQHGVGFALDDFGTGYSSLSYLWRLPLDQLKIDRSFVRDLAADPKAEAILQAIISLGRSLGLQVIAEGVETQQQRLLLEKLGCEAWQGFLLSPALPIAQFEPLVRTWPGTQGQPGPQS